MDLEQAETVARELMAEHLPGYWEFAFHRRKRHMGNCNFTRTTIFLSVHFVAIATPEELDQVVRHEIAHALAGPDAGHGPVWVQQAIEIGVKDPSRSIETVNDIPARYQATCEHCGHTYRKHRWTNRVANSACTRCCRDHNGGKYSADFILTWVDTAIGADSVRRRTATSQEINMSGKLSARELAERIGTDPKTLRRFLRENDSFRNPGSGGRYEFTEKEAQSAERAFKVWRANSPRRAQTSPKSSAKSKTQRSSEDAKQRARERVDALEASLKSSGKHISQYVAWNER